MPRSAQQKRPTVKKIRFDELHQEGRPVGGGKPRPQSATGWSQGLALAALSPRTRQKQAAERRHNGASFRAAVAPICDELSVAAREFAPTRSVDDVAMPPPMQIPSRKYQGSASSPGLAQLKRPRPLSAVSPARERCTPQTRPHTAGSYRSDACGLKSAASVDRQPSTAQRQRIQLYREGKRQLLAKKKAADDQQLQSAGFRRHGSGRWVSQSFDDLRAPIVDCDNAGTNEGCRVVRQYCKAINADDSLRQTDSGQLCTGFFAFVAEQRRLAAGNGDISDSHSEDPAEFASQLSELWKKLQLEEVHGSVNTGGDSSGAGGRATRKSISRIASAYDRATAATRISFAYDRKLSSRRNETPISASTSIGVAAATWWSPQPQKVRGSANGGGSTKQLHDSADDLLRVTRLMPQMQSATKQRHESPHEPGDDVQQDRRGEVLAVVGSSDRRLLHLVTHSPELFARSEETAQRFSEPVAGSESLLKTGWCN